jgi:hypothetical protein
MMHQRAHALLGGDPGDPRGADRPAPPRSCSGRPCRRCRRNSPPHRRPDITSRTLVVVADVAEHGFDLAHDTVGPHEHRLVGAAERRRGRASPPSPCAGRCSAPRTPSRRRSSRVSTCDVASGSPAPCIVLQPRAGNPPRRAPPPTTRGPAWRWTPDTAGAARRATGHRLRNPRPCGTPVDSLRGQD